MASTRQLKRLAEDTQQLAKCMQQYADYLDDQRNAIGERHSLQHPVRLLADNVNVQHRHAVFAPKDCYKALDEAVQKAEPFKPVSIHNFMPEYNNGTGRFRFFENLHLSVPVDMLKYAPGGSYLALGFVWKVSKERTPEQEQTQTIQIYETIRCQLPQFHSRAMKAAFKEEFQRLSTITPSVIETIYQRLTLDRSTHANPVVNERIRLILLGETGLIEDLRTQNQGRPNTKYDTFFEHLGCVVNEVMAADERRHGEAHLAHWISLPDLIHQAACKCPPNTAIPSKALVRIQFTPKNPYSQAALQFTSRFPVQYKIQVRQLRASHPDNHFVAALLLYLKHFVILLGKAKCCLLFCDDKAKVPFGEPGHVVSTGVRGRSSLAPTTSTYNAADHDFNHKGSLTPSVYFDSVIPESVQTSFYRGKIHVSVKDSVFQQSNPLRHGAAMLHILRNRQGGVPPVLAKFSDGGTDQRITLQNVKCSLIAVFKLLNLDLLIACRCAPGQSWINLAERCMSLLNLGLQNCALERGSCSQEVEKKVKYLGGGAAIREAGAADPNLAAEWKESVKPLQVFVKTTFQSSLPQYHIILKVKLNGLGKNILISFDIFLENIECFL